MSVRLVLPEPPSANRYWRVGNGHAYKSAEARAYRQTIIDTSDQQLTAWERATLPLEGNIGVTLVWYRSAKRGDLDNRAKVALDALKGILFQDDKQVVRLLMLREESPRSGRIEVTVEAA